MNGLPTTFWGKLERSSATKVVSTWHPLVDHCVDVAACAEALLDLQTWRGRLARCCGRTDLDHVTRARLTVLAALHDLGKFNLGFQAKGRPELGATAGHVTPAVAAIAAAALPSVEALGEWGEGTGGLLISALCHHGRPYSCESAGRHEPALWERRGALDPVAGVASLVERCKTWFPSAFCEDAPPLPTDARFEHAFAGLVMLADWVGSDNGLFAYSESRDGDRLAFARATATTFLTGAWLRIDQTRRSEDAGTSTFARVAAPTFHPTVAQSAMLELPTDENGSITILEAETGSGKTEAALARFLELFDAGAVDGLYFALPTRTAATQMHQRILTAVRHAFADPPPVVLAVPGYLRVDDSNARRLLAQFSVLWPDHERFRFRAWAGETPKRYLASCIAVGTIDQVLLSALRVGHAHLRATALFRQLLVVDEVHASDSYMMRILEEVLDRHRRAGGHALLLSATLGAEARTRLLQPRSRTPSPTLEEAICAPYPLVSHHGTHDLTIDITQPDRQREILIELLPSLEVVDVVATRALDAARQGAKVLVVKNTVADCVETQRSLERLAALHSTETLLFTCGQVPAPHHARFARVDREALDRSLVARIGKERPSGGCVVVATQTVQQSLDLDADYLITDLCPMDVLIQRVGRLHRHGRERPEGFEAARATVVVPATRDLGVLLGTKGRARHHHGLGTVYDDLRVLEATWQSIEQHRAWRLPEMSRLLVERSVHSAALSAISASYGGLWSAHEQWAAGMQRGEVRQADLNLVDWEIPYSETTFSDGERVPTRLGDSDRRVHFAQPFDGPFGLSVGELIVPGRWALGIPAAEEAARDVEHANRMTSFRFGNRAFVYDRCGLRLQMRPQEADDADDDGS